MPHETPKTVVYAKSHRRTSPRRLTPAFRPPLHHEAVGQEDQGPVLLFPPLEPPRGRTAAVSEPASGPTRRRGGGSDGGDLTVGQLADRCPTRNRCLADARALALRTLHDSCVRCCSVAKAFGRDCRVGHQNVPPMGWRPATSTGRGRWRTTLATGCSGPQHRRPSRRLTLAEGCFASATKVSLRDHRWWVPRSTPATPRQHGSAYLCADPWLSCSPSWPPP
jgi:hypothetical protein